MSGTSAGRATEVACTAASPYVRPVPLAESRRAETLVLLPPLRTMTKLLVVEDEPALLESLHYSLAEEGFEVVTAEDGEAALRLVESERPDLVVLDLMLPGVSGTEVCRLIRGESSLPIIMLTAKDAEVDRVLGLELGADDYVTKPFSMRELTARVRAVLRRGAGTEEPEEEEPLEAAGVRVDPSRYEVTVRGRLVTLPPKEFALLELLIANAGHVLPRHVLIDRVWGPDYVGDTKTLDVHVKRLRQRLETDPRNPQILLTVRGVGYKLADR